MLYVEDLLRSEEIITFIKYMKKLITFPRLFKVKTETEIFSHEILTFNHENSISKYSRNKALSL